MAITEKITAMTAAVTVTARTQTTQFPSNNLNNDPYFRTTMRTFIAIRDTVRIDVDQPLMWLLTNDVSMAATVLTRLFETVLSG